MGIKRAKRAKTSAIRPKMIGVILLCAVLCILLIALCINVIMRANMQSKYAAVRNEIGEELYSQLYMLCQTSDQVSVPGADLEDTVIPQLRDYFVAAQALNNVLYNAYGEQYLVIDSDLESEMEDVFDAFNTAFKSGKGTDDAESALESCVASIREVLTSRYSDDILLST